jgi:hypothetical protein
MEHEVEKLSERRAPDTRRQREISQTLGEESEQGKRTSGSFTEATPAFTGSMRPERLPCPLEHQIHEIDKVEADDLRRSRRSSRAR